MKGIGLVLVLVGFMAMGFFIGKCTNKPVNKEIILPDVSRHTDKINALERRFKSDSALITKLYFSLDSVKALTPINHKKLTNDIKTTKTFSRPKLKSYIDSIYESDSK